MKVGYAKARFSPPIGSPCSLGLENELIEVFDDPHVRTIWLEVNGEPALISAVDVLQFDPGDAGEFRSAIARATSIPEDRIILHTIHTHLAPNSHWESSSALQPYGLADLYADPQVKAQVQWALVDSARKAIDSAMNSLMAYAETPVTGVASNRRVPIPGLSDQVVFRSSRPLDELRELPEGDIDPLARLVIFRPVDGDGVIAICNYNCHPTAGGGDEGPYVSADFPGMAMTLAEDEMAGLQLLHLTGTAGEINPGKYVSSSDYRPESRRRDIRRLGRRYANAILAAVRAADEWFEPSVLCLRQQEAIDLPIHPTFPSVIELTAELNDEVQSYWVDKAAGTARRGPFRRLVHKLNVWRHATEGHLPIPAATLRLDDIYFSFMPGEIFLTFGQALRAHLGEPKLLNVSYCYGSNFGYLVPAQAFLAGGYEPTATALAPEAYDHYLVAMKRLLDDVRGL